MDSNSFKYLGKFTVWALGEIDDIQRLRDIWSHVLRGTKYGRILECTVDPIGVREEVGYVEGLGSQ